MQIDKDAESCFRQRPSAGMYTSTSTFTFAFATAQLDDPFHTLDQEIATLVIQVLGYLDEETWENKATGLVSNLYYWQSLEALQQLVQHPSHQ